MISPISSSVTSAISASTPKPAQQPPAQTQAPQDTVHLSPQAQAALGGGGDVDHDGDSH